MNESASRRLSRRELLWTTAAVVGWSRLPRAQAPQPDPLAALRARHGAAPIVTLALGDRLAMLSGPGGNVAVLSGPDGTIAVDTFVQPARAALKHVLDARGGRLAAAINTHWHFDHTDNNALFRQSGAIVVAHANTVRRLSETQEVAGLRIEPVSPAERPTDTFTETRTMQANGEILELGHLPLAHTDTDIYIRFAHANVLHLGDTYFNGGYPFIDTGTGGAIGGLIGAADRALALADGSTKIVPGHGPLSDRDALARYRDMLVTVRDRVQKLKSSGRTLDEVVAAKPTADLDAAWKAFVQPAQFVTAVYNTL
jgi:cyclase